MGRPVVLDPRAVPVLGTDAHLPSIDPARLTPAALRARFAAPPAGWHPEWPGDGRLLDREPAAAAVLIALVVRPDAPGVLLTLRTDHLKDHAGQISFPGGRTEPSDRDAVETALREAEEEIGLPRAQVEVIGRLPAYTTVTNFVVTPVVGLVPDGLALRPDPFEVATVFEVPLTHLMAPANHRRHAFEGQGVRREFLSMPWQPAPDAPEVFVWGATAAMLRNLYGFLTA